MNCAEVGNSDPFESVGSCETFCQCSNNVTYELPCAPGTAFNPAIGVCDWPYNVPGCGKFTILWFYPEEHFFKIKVSNNFTLFVNAVLAHITSPSSKPYVVIEFSLNDTKLTMLPTKAYTRKSKINSAKDYPQWVLNLLIITLILY